MMAGPNKIQLQFWKSDPVPVQRVIRWWGAYSQLFMFSSNKWVVIRTLIVFYYSCCLSRKTWSSLPFDWILNDCSKFKLPLFFWQALKKNADNFFFFVCRSYEVSVIFLLRHRNLPSPKFLVEQRAFKEHDFKGIALSKCSDSSSALLLPDR